MGSVLSIIFGADAKDGLQVLDKEITQANSTIKDIERNTFATIDSGVDNFAYTANNLIASTASTLQIPLFFGMIISAVVIIRLLQIVKDPKVINSLSGVLKEVIQLIRENTPRASIST